MSDAADIRAAAIVVAGGTGERFGAPGGKQLAAVRGLPVLSHALRALDAVRSIGLIVVVCHPDRLDEFATTALAPAGLHTPHVLVGGGESRMDSVRNGLSAVPESWPYVVVHDGARPLILPETVESAIDALVANPACAGVVVGQPAYDTIKEVEGRRILGTPDRSRYWVVQTPQVFAAAALRAAYACAPAGAVATDDAAILEAAGGVVEVLEGPRDNIKVTVARDLALVEAVLRDREER